MDQGHFGLKFFAAEIVVVAVGVFLGLGVETLWSEHRETAAAQEALETVVSDLTADLSDMNVALRGQAAIADTLDFILEGDRQQVLARAGAIMQEGLTRSPTVFPRRGAFVAISAGGHLGRLDDPSLVRALSSIYERDYSRLEYQGELYDADMAEVWDGYRQLFDWESGQLIESDQAAQVHFINQLRLWRLWADSYSRLVTETRESVRRVANDVRAVPGLRAQ